MAVLAVALLVTGSGWIKTARDLGAANRSQARAAATSARFQAQLIDQVAALQAQLKGLQEQLTDPARFVLVASNFTDACGYSNCPVSASFINQGGALGGGVAIFWVQSQDGSVTYGTCSAAIPSTPKYGTATVGCSANGVGIRDYFVNNPRGSVWLKVTVSNPVASQTS